jgi:hypothetical protein
MENSITILLQKYRVTAPEPAEKFEVSRRPAPEPDSGVHLRFQAQNKIKPAAQKNFNFFASQA